jgi:uncharacterized caspase-like protein
MLQRPLLKDILQLRYRVSRALNAGSCLIALALVFMLVPLSAAPVESQKRVALIIGNSAYRGRLALDNPRNDAEAFAEALKKVSPRFEIVKITDMQAKDRDVVLSRLEQIAANSSIALFYYAGHALQANDDNYLLPVDMPERPATLSGLQALRLSEVLDRMKGATRAKLVFLDACRNNPFKTQQDTLPLASERTRQAAGIARLLRDGLARPAASSFGTGDIFIAYATAPGSVAQDGTGKNSPFTTALARYIPERGLEIKKMQMLVTKAVKEATKGQPQIPWFSVSLTSDLYLWPPAPAAPPPPPVAGSSSAKTAEGTAVRPPAKNLLPPGLGGGIGAGGL